MAVHQPRLFLLAYDISDPDRLARVHRTVRRWGIPLQYSVFLLPISAADVDAVLGELAGIIDEKEDDVRVYPLPARLQWTHYGRQPFPEGVDLIGDDLTGSVLDPLASGGPQQ